MLTKVLRAENKAEATENLLRALRPYEDSLTDKFFGGNVFNSVQCNNNTGNTSNSIIMWQNIWSNIEPTCQN